MDNRLEGAHRAREAALEQQVKDLQEAVQHRGREVTLEQQVKDLQEAVQHRDEEKLTLMSDLELEKKKLGEKDGELAVQQVEVERERAKVVELSGSLKGLNVKLAVSSERCASLDAQLSRRTRELAEKTEEVRRVGVYFRTRVQRLLRKQWRAHHRFCWDRNRAAKRILDRYLKSRKHYNAVDKYLSQAKGTKAILESLIARKVPIPADVIAEVVGKVAEYEKSKAKLKLEEIYPDDFFVHLPEGLGVPNLERIGFGVSPEEEEDSSEEDPGIIEEESSEEDDGEGEDVLESVKKGTGGSVTTPDAALMSGTEVQRMGEGGEAHQ